MLCLQILCSRSASRIFFVVIGNCEVALAMCLSRHICCAGKTADDKGAFTAHLCYQCWASEEADRSLEGLFKWRYICLGDVGLFEEDEWEFLMGAFADAVNRIEEQRVKTPEERQAEKPWNRNDIGAPRMAHGAVVDEDMPALKALEGKTVWSLEALLEINPKFIERLRSLKRRRLRPGPT